ncbi:MAG: PhoPQ-activated pathogenicity-related family protein [Cyclobacteriaceae bacterium]|nr:PhoPQ-activated pathogenicity-related family protein [Cyclobacteriaceae bacterium]
MKSIWGILLFAFLTIGCKPAPEENKSSSPLFDYVLAKDTSFRYELLKRIKGDGYTFYVAKMTSQHWLTPSEVNMTKWWHYVTVVVPDQYTYETGMMWIGGGSHKDSIPDKPDFVTQRVARATQSVVAQVTNIPFQPLMFPGDSVERYEDAIIAYGWRKFLEGGAKDEDAKWLSRLPMTDAVVSAMDVVQDILQQKQHKPVNQFVVAGASKRGWTTWTTGAIDKRVVAIVPIVIDLLNVVPSFAHHYRSYGAWSHAVDDYVHEGIMDWMGSKEFNRLLEVTEPYSYRHLYTMPKLLINASGDEFFLPDSWKFYYDDLPGEKHLMYVPNSGHNVGRSDALQNLTSFYASILDNQPRPGYKWSIQDGHFDIQTDSIPPVEVKLWQAHNDSARDFRIDVLGPRWTSSPIPVSADGHYRVEIATPTRGYSGFFVELTYAGKLPLKVTTGIEVLPRTEPFGDYQPAVPKGTRP